MSGADATGAVMMLAPVCAGLKALGFDPERLLAPHGLREADLADPRRRLANASLIALWESAQRETGNQNFGIVAAQSYTPGMFHVLDYIVSSAPDLGTALSRAMPHMRLLHDLLEVELKTSDTEATLVLQPNRRTPLLRAQADFFMGALVLVVRRLTGLAGSPIQVTFRHTAPDDSRAARELFRCPVLYQASADSISFHRRLLSQPSREADSKLAAIVTEHAAVIGQQLPTEDALIGRLKQVLSSQLNQGPRVLAVARELAMSERTLRRRLDELGTTFRAVLLDLRLETARRLMQDRECSLDTVAREVGFANGRALARAYRRERGQALSQVAAQSREVP